MNGSYSGIDLICLSKDPVNLDAYLTHNIFLPDVNNEKSQKNSTYAQNMSKLDAFVMFRFRDDTVGEASISVSNVAAE